MFLLGFFSSVQSLSCALKWSIDSISMQIMLKFWADKRSHCEIAMLCYLHMVRIFNAFVRYHSFLICISAHLSVVFFIQLHLFLFYVGTLFGLFIFICERKKTVAILTFEFFFLLFVLHEKCGGWWRTAQEMCIYQKNRNLPKINCHLAENSSIQITAQSAF